MKTIGFNYWPSFLVFLFIVLSFVCGWTVKVSMDHPVELDNLYRPGYQYINEHINELQSMSRTFDQKGYQVVFKSSPKLGKNTVEFSILNKDLLPVSNAQVDLLITRRATTKDDIRVGILNFESDVYKVRDIEISKPGPWIFNVQIQLDGLTVTRLFEKTI